MTRGEAAHKVASPPSDKQKGSAMAGHAYTCPVCGFSSVGHETKKQRDARGKQHEAEHETGEVMPEIADFMKAGGK